MFYCNLIFFSAYPPNFEERVPDKTLTHTGGSVKLVCVVKAAPAATFTWLKDNSTINIENEK